MVEASPSNYLSGEPGVSNVNIAIEKGLDIVLVNRDPIALKGLNLLKKAERYGVRMLYLSLIHI